MSALFICEECRTRENLTAVAGANVSGALNADGTVVESHSDQWGTYHESIQCEVHLGARVLELRNGEYTVTAPCGTCGGTGVVGYGKTPCRRCRATYWQNGYKPSRWITGGGLLALPERVALVSTAAPAPSKETSTDGR